MIEVGYIRESYPDIRCIINKISNHSNEIMYKKIKNENIVRSFYKTMQKIHLKRTNPNEYIFQTRDRTIDVIHTFNHICYTEKPWITTFETILPRRDEILHYQHENSSYKITKKVEKDIKVLASDNCKKIIALSECTKSIQEEFLKNFDKSIEEKIKNKILVIHPPQKLLLTDEQLAEKMNLLENEIKFLLIGNQFFKKGGQEVINVLGKLRKEYKIKIKLIIISNITTDEEVTYTKEVDKNKMIFFLNENKDWIEWHQNIKNEEVLEIAKISDVGLLPTIADTYGYSVLEMQAAAIPVITTDIRALPEINNKSCGWICKIPKNDFNEALYSNEDSRKRTQEILEEELEKNIREVLDNPLLIKEKGLKAYERIKKEHSPYDYGNKLYKLYKEAIK